MHIQNKLVSGSWDTSIRIWNMDTFAVERTINHHTGPVRALSMCSGNLISASGDCTVAVWDPVSWGLVRSLDEHTDQVNCVAEFQNHLVTIIILSANPNRREVR